LTKLEISHS